MSSKLFLNISKIEDGERSRIKIFYKEDGKLKQEILGDFKPYFFIEKKDVSRVRKISNRFEIGEKTEKRLDINQERELVKIFFENTKELKNKRELFRERGINVFEGDIPFQKRFVIDKRSFLNKNYRFPILEDVKIASLDIETHNPDEKMLRFSDPKKDRIMLISLTFYEAGKNKKRNKIFLLNPGKIKVKLPSYVSVYDDEREMLLGLKKEIEEQQVDVLLTYNGDNFDLPYIKERSARLGREIDFFGERIRKSRTPMGETISRIETLQHIDVYKIVRFLAAIEAYDIFQFKLERVYEYLFKESKMEFDKLKMSKSWEDGDRELLELIEYNRQDSDGALRIALDFIDLFFGLSALLYLSLDDITRATTGQMVEQMTMLKAYDRKYLIPEKPGENEVRERLKNPIKGAFVKEPERGLHKDIYVMDFQSLYPTIIISYNISPEMLNKKARKKMVVPGGRWFAADNVGLISGTIKELLEKRLREKEALTKLNKKFSEYRKKFAKQWALKIILNSFYGYLAYARSRWYSRETAESITALGRFYLKKTIEEAEKTGLRVIYGDTDSLFISSKDEKKVMRFLKKINKELPGGMSLGLEGKFKAGIFVERRAGMGVAKKRYALLDEKDNIKVVGFETVRRDWAEIAKKAQRKVIELVLKGREKEAVKYVKEKVGELRKGKTTLKDLVIYTRLKKELKHYETTGPHIEAVKRAREKGQEIESGSLIGYIITKEGSTISKKARLMEDAKNYDAEYYINNQLIPAVLKILREIGYKKDDLIFEGKQKKIGEFFG